MNGLMDWRIVRNVVCFRKSHVLNPFFNRKIGFYKNIVALPLQGIGELSDLRINEFTNCS